jgi:hypothetical protein
MGYIRHHSILVTAYNKEYVQKAWDKANKLFPEILTPIISSLWNGYYSFAILPDGSKEGWPESDELDRLRARYKRWIRTLNFDDGSSPFDWVEVSIDEEGRTKITSSTPKE